MPRVDMNRFESMYAERVGARATRFVEGHSPEGALARSELLHERDRLVVFDPDAASLSGAFENGCVRRVVDGLDPAAFNVASGDDDGYDRLFWLVPVLGGRDNRVCDVRALAAAARIRAAVLIVDVTAVSPFAAHPLESGACLMLEQLGEGCSGPSSSLFALSAAFPSRRRGTDERLAWVLPLLLGAPAVRAEYVMAEPFGRFAMDGVQRRMDSARAIAEYLAANEMVPAVSYPGLPTHPDHGVAASNLMHGFGFNIDVHLPEHLSAGQFIQALPRSLQAPSSGCDRTRIVSVKGLNEPFIRLIVGLDDPLCIVDSLDQALRLYCNPPEPL